MDGRVKTLHPGGARRPARRARRSRARRSDARRTRSRPIDLLVVNLYPFEETVARGADFDDCIENIDIGGPAMIRAAAKNHAYVAVVVDAGDYAAVLDELTRHGGTTTLALRRRLAAKAYARTAAYDAAISNWFARELERDGAGLSQPSAAGSSRRCATAKTRTSRRRSIARRDARFGVATRAAAAGQAALLQQHQRHRRRLRVRRRVRSGARRGLRHHQARQSVRRGRGRNPARRLPQGAAPAIRSSAFGGIVALNRPLDADAAREIVEIFTEVIIAPDADRRSASPSSRQRRTCACCWPAACPIRAPRV